MILFFNLCKATVWSIVLLFHVKKSRYNIHKFREIKISKLMFRWNLISTHAPWFCMFHLVKLWFKMWCFSRDLAQTILQFIMNMFLDMFFCYSFDCCAPTKLCLFDHFCGFDCTQNDTKLAWTIIFIFITSFYIIFRVHQSRNASLFFVQIKMIKCALLVILI